MILHLLTQPTPCFRNQSNRLITLSPGFGTRFSNLSRGFMIPISSSVLEAETNKSHAHLLILLLDSSERFLNTLTSQSHRAKQYNKLIRCPVKPHQPNMKLVSLPRVNRLQRTRPSKLFNVLVRFIRT